MVGNYDRPTDRADQQANTSVHREVTLPINFVDSYKLYVTDNEARISGLPVSDEPMCLKAAKLILEALLSQETTFLQCSVSTLKPK